MDDTDRRSHYEVLGLPRDATYDQIKESFHRLARAKHPDKQHLLGDRDGDRDDNDNDDNDGTHDQHAETTAAAFRRIQRAWKVLRDADERAAYDSDLVHKDLQEENRRNGAIVLNYHDDLEEALDEETNETFMVYDCRCGEEIHIDDFLHGSSDADADADTDTFTDVGNDTAGQSTTGYGPVDDLLVDCPGCCFVYRIVGK
eukprot:jgi/Psemu1/204741/e_gw1.355.52.1